MLGARFKEGEISWVWQLPELVYAKNSPRTWSNRDRRKHEKSAFPALTQREQRNVSEPATTKTVSPPSPRRYYRFDTKAGRPPKTPPPSFFCFSWHRFKRRAPRFLLPLRVVHHQGERLTRKKRVHDLDQARALSWSGDVSKNKTGEPAESRRRKLGNWVDRSTVLQPKIAKPKTSHDSAET